MNLEYFSVYPGKSTNRQADGNYLFLYKILCCSTLLHDFMWCVCAVRVYDEVYSKSFGNYDEPSKAYSVMKIEEFVFVVIEVEIIQF